MSFWADRSLRKAAVESPGAPAASWFSASTARCLRVAFNRGTGWSICRIHYLRFPLTNHVQRHLRHCSIRSEELRSTMPISSLPHVRQRSDVTGSPTRRPARVLTRRSTPTLRLVFVPCFMGPRPHRAQNIPTEFSANRSECRVAGGKSARRGCLSGQSVTRVGRLGGWSLERSRSNPLLSRSQAAYPGPPKA